jgi:hypothetical protein
VGHAARIEKIRKPEGKRPIRKHSSRCEDNIKVDLKETVRLYESVDWSDVAALVNTVINLLVP